jgi:hypothetical protein
LFSRLCRLGQSPITKVIAIILGEIAGFHPKQVRTAHNAVKPNLWETREATLTGED